MEQLMNLSELNIVSEIELVYKTKVKPSESPLDKSAKDCHELLSIEGRKKLLLQGQRKLLFYDVIPGLTMDREE